MSKNKRRSRTRGTTGPPGGAPAEQAATDGPRTTEVAGSAEERRARQIKEWEARKKEKEKKERRKNSGSALPWIGGGVAVAVVAGVGAVLLLSGGGSSDSSEPVVTPDARVAGLPVDKTVELVADDDGQAANPRFVPTEVVGQAGEVIEFQVANEGDVAHNLTVSGLDKEYATPDDFTSPTLEAGESGTLLVKIDEPGTYPFRCDFHPQQQVGTLILG